MTAVDIDFCNRRIAEDEHLAVVATSAVDAASHYQPDLLKKAQLKILRGTPSLFLLRPKVKSRLSKGLRLAALAAAATADKAAVPSLKSVPW
jgi:hypothetical protein